MLFRSDGPVRAVPRVPLIIVALGVIAAATGVIQVSAVAFLLVLAGFTGLASVLADRHRDR